MIRSLSEPTEESPSTSTFRTLDIDYFFNAKLSLDECKKRLVEINAYYFQSHQRASKILEQFDFQKDTIAALKEECKRLNVEMHNLEEMLFPLKQKRQDNIRLKAENAHLKKMIKTHITDPIVLSMIEGTKPPISEATALIAPEGKEPAMLNISKFEKESENLPPSIADIKNFINKRK